MRGLAYKVGLRLSHIDFIRSAIDDKADLSAFDHRPTIKLVVGIFLIAASNTLCWPAITALAGVAVYYRRPWICVIGGPLVYGISFLACTGGIALSGGKYARLFFRWLLRVWVERLLSYQDARS